MDILLEPLQYGFFRNGLAVAVLAGALCGLVGVFVVLRSMSYIGHGLSHAVFGGAVVSEVIGINLFLGGGAWAVLSVLLVARLSRRRGVRADAAIGIVTTASFALGVALLSTSQGFTRNLEATLFGNVLGATSRDAVVVAAVLAVTAAIVFLRYRSLLYVTFDPDVAEATGVGRRGIETLLAVMLAATVVSTIPVLGVTLIAAAVVVPAATARLVVKSFEKMLLLATLIGAAGGAIGLYLSYHTDIASGAAVVLVDTAVFAVVYAATALRTRLSRELGVRGV